MANSPRPAIKPIAEAIATFTTITLAVMTLLTLLPAPPATAQVRRPPVRPSAWTPPEWLDWETALVLENLDTEARFDAPRLRSRHAIVADLDRGEVLFAHRADEPASVASLTKLVSGLAMLSTTPDLSRELCVTSEHYPTRSGAFSSFETGICHTGWEWFGAAMVRSDNRGAMGMASLSDLAYDNFIDRMNSLSAELGMHLSTWTDPTGLEDENMASARDMLKAVIATAAAPELTLVGSAPWWQIDTRRGPKRLYSTNRLRERFDVEVAKTGYTDTARYCFASVLRTDNGRRLATVVLGAPSSRARFEDTLRLVRAAEAR